MFLMYFKTFQVYSSLDCSMINDSVPNYFKTFQVYSSYIEASRGFGHSIYFKTFQVYSSLQVQNLHFLASFSISKLFKFIVHLHYLKN